MYLAKMMATSPRWIFVVVISTIVVGTPLLAQDHADHDHATHEESQSADEPGHEGHNHAEHEETQTVDEPGHEGHNHGTAEDGRPWCGEHDVAEEECAICNPALTASLMPGQGLKLRMPSESAIDKAGVQISAAIVGRGAGSGQFPARVTYNESQMAHVTPLISGIVRKVFVELGQTIEVGQPLAEITSPDVAQSIAAYRRASAELTLANQTAAREKDLHAKKISSASDYQSAQAEASAASAEKNAALAVLMDFGVSEADIASMQQDTAGVASITLRAPISGTLIERHAVNGESFESGTQLFTVADLSSMWLALSIPMSNLSDIAAGDIIQARFQGLAGVVLEGNVTWIDSKIDESTRTVQARAVVANPGAMLKHGLFGEVTLSSQVTQDDLLLPVDAVQRYDGKPFVFVKLEDGLFEVRNIELGKRAGDLVVVSSGLTVDEPVVTSRSYTVKSEFLKARLGAGCVD